MDKENGKTSENSSGASKVSNVQDPAALLDAASLFGAYWPRGDASAANLFAAASGFGLPPHAAAALPFGMLPPGAAAAATQSSRGGSGGGGAGGTSSSGTGLPPSYPAASSASSASAAAAAAAYSNAAYSNTLSVAASQAASLGMPAASAAWWSMASHLAAQDYLARLQASGLNFSMGGPADPYAALGLPSLAAMQQHGKSKSSSKSSMSRSAGNAGKDKLTAASMTSGSTKMDHQHNSKMNSGLSVSKSSSNNSLKYSSPTGLTIQPSISKIPNSSSGSSVGGERGRKSSSSSSSTSANDLNYLSKVDNKQKTSASTSVKPSSDSPSIFTNPLSMASTQDKSGTSVASVLNSASLQNSVNSGSVAGLPASILSSDPNSILGGVRLPPDTEIIKYTSSIVGPKVPGTTNRGRKKTISLDPPSVSVLPSGGLSGGLYIERTSKRPKLSDHDITPPGTPSSDRVEVIKLPATNGSPSGISSYSGATEGTGEAPLNLSLKPASFTSNTGTSSSLNSLSNMSASIGTDRISRRKPGPKPRRVIPMESTPPPTTPPGMTQSQYYPGAESPRPPSRNEGSDGGSSTSSTSATTSGGGQMGPLSNHKEGRPRNLGRGVSKPKKNTVASLLAQSRALGIKPVPMLDPNVSMNQQMSLLKSNILAAQQYISEAGGDEKALNKFLQERFKGALSDGSAAEASDSDNLTDSNHTDSEFESESSTHHQQAVASKRQKQYDERLLRVPLEKGWRRETIIRGVTKNGGIKGDVTYAAPDSSNKFKQMSDVTQYLEYQKSTELTKENFTFSCRVIIGDYMQPVPPEMQMQTDGNEFIYLTEEDVTKRLEELRAAMRTSLPVEQRIEMARKQQAARAAARLDREQQRLTKELERTERQEAARREKEARTQQMLEAKRKRQEEADKQKHEEHQRKQQERELKRQQAAMLKEQIYIQEINKQREMLYTVELEKERRRQHLALIKAMENRRKMEEKERRKQQLMAEKQANKEKKLEQRKADLEILTELRKPCEDLELQNQKPLPEYERMPGLKLPGKAFADCLMVFEFLHNFGETLGFDMESLPTLESLQQALLSNEHSFDAEEELFSVMTHLLVCAIEDPGIPHPARHTTILGQSLRQADITTSNLSEILRIYLYANATGEIKALTGVHFERDRERRIADHHQTEEEMQQTTSGKNSHYYELLHDNGTYKMSELLKDKPFMALSPTDKAAILAFICNELLQNKAVLKQIDHSMATMIENKRDKWLLDQKIRKLKVLHNRKIKSEAIEKSHGEDGTLDSPHILHKDELLDEEEHEMSDNESVGTQPEEEEDAKLSTEELAKKLEKLMQTSENHLTSSNTAFSQLRAVTFGEDRYFRRYWSLSKSGGIFVEAMESAEPEEFEEQLIGDHKETISNGIRSLNELNSVIENVEKINDHTVDKEVSNIVKVEAEGKTATDDNENEHRKTPNRLENVENGEIMDRSERNLEQLKRSVDDIVQNLERNLEREKEQKIKETLDVKMETYAEPISNRKFNLFERLGQCMERENKTEEDLKADVKAEVKEELKNEILKELKQEIKTEQSTVKSEYDENEEVKWFSILPKDGSTCDEVHLTTNGKWENGVCPKECNEPRVPVFPSNQANHNYNCDSPAPLQMTSEESAQLEHIKKHGKPALPNKKSVPPEKRYGWWRMRSLDQLREVLDNLHVRGVRERELKRSFLLTMQQMYNKGKLVIEQGHPELTDMTGEGLEEVMMAEGGAPMPYEAGWWSKAIAHRVDMFLLEQVEALEDKVASASMQVKGWKVPERDTSDVPYGEVVAVVKEKLASLEMNIERRYMKPPLGINANFRSSSGGNSTTTSQTQDNTQQSGSPSEPSTPNSGTPNASQCSLGTGDDIPKGLATWREAVQRASTSAQLAMCLYSLESSIAWDKSIMKAVSEQAEFSIQNARKYNSKLSNCQFCQSGDNEDKLLLCDSCDRGYHTYCFKPKMDNIPDGDWYCHECMNKATGERNCIVCGRKVSATGTRLIACEICPRAYHTDCIQPQIHKVPRGKWYCATCISKKPPKKAVKKNKSAPTTPAKESESCEQPPPPASPTPSHSSVTTNEDVPTTNCSQGSDVSIVSNASSVITVEGSPSASAAAKKEKDKEKAQKKLIKELAPCKAILDELELHDDAWPFLLPVNTKQFPTYKKIIKIPMDLSTIKKRLQDLTYKSREDFCTDVRQIFNNCETFNEDDSPVGKAGHCMRQFFEAKWNELCSNHS
ncbi:bromodomain adjacent to zinc finger domain protein 2B isoform X3 [Anthonomus grandis grandis]|uniref:bromodomain adjacent to zinc finger domain protein 2B isoform X3 n=1 Tax=Anthonomus grandis grandis TaxID=2921223 RepID=UPI002166A933|nr:bromodomain adjacent to zinc finger domain protein 2B isoform X3 [Anthonomus grandis grandis]